MSEIPYKVFNEMVLRTPVYSINSFLKLTNDKKTDTERLKNIWSKLLVRESIFLASQDVYKNLLLWEKGEIKSEKKREKLERTLFKYLVRMSTRCTPFGLFAGYSNCKFSDATKVVLENEKKFERQIKLDCEYLFKLSRKYLRTSDNNDNVLWFPNSTIYDSNKSIRYVESNFINNTKQLTTESILKNEYVVEILDSSYNGLTLLELKEILMDKEVSEIEGEVFLNQLIENQLLVSNCELNLTGKHYSEVLKDIFYDAPEFNISEQIEIFKKNRDYSIINLEAPVKVDLFKQTLSSSISKKWKKDILKCLSFFNKISPKKKITRLEVFKNEFRRKFGTMEIPLAKVLDVEYGINYLKTKNSFDNYTFLSTLKNKRNKKYNDPSLDWNETTSILNQKLLESKNLNQKEIILTGNDFKGLNDNWDDLPNTIFSIIEIFRIDERESLFINSIGGKTAASIISRFSNENEEINNLTKQIIELEENKNKDKILAEIIHVPSTKVANVLCRPLLREYEIPYLAKSMVSSEKQIAVSDLVVTVRDDEVILKSSKLNKEIMPMLTCSHDYSNSKLPIYQFLCDVSFSENNIKVGFDWGSLLSIYRYLPRVIYEGVIVSKARWVFNKNDIKHLLDVKGNILHEVSIWKKKHEIPSIIKLIDSDYSLMTNLNNQNSVEIFLQELSNKKWFSIEEVLCLEDTPVEDDQGDFYANEFIISLGQV